MCNTDAKYKTLQLGELSMVKCKGHKSVSSSSAMMGGWMALQLRLSDHLCVFVSRHTTYMCWAECIKAHVGFYFKTIVMLTV